MQESDISRIIIEQHTETLMCFAILILLQTEFEVAGAMNECSSV